jgi:hypothetical protein
MAPAPLRTAPAYRAITSLQALTPLNTVGLFAAPGPSVDPSPIDQFIANTEVINIIYMPAPDPLPAEFGTLVLLGYMSAVESFFRALLRGLINIDEHTRRLAEPMNVSFGAALHHRPSLLPEALFEEMSFAGLRNIEIMLREIIGIKGQFPGEILTVLSEFKKVCELRHCCIHRFGKLGAKNAITLGLERHSQILEHPFSPTKDNLQEIADLLRTFAKTINNFIFHSVLNRTTDTRYRHVGDTEQKWSWNYNQDRKYFVRYYTLFAATIDSPPSPPARIVYDSFREAMQVPNAKRGRKR